MDVIEFLLVRHPETQANVDVRFVGRGDSPYTAEGRRQLERITRTIARFGPDVIWSSPLTRALTLAEEAAALSSARLAVDRRLMEIDFGEVEGMTYDEIVASGNYLNYKDQEAPVSPGGESRGAVEARAAAVCEAALAAGGRHCLVTHGGVFRASLVHLLGLASTDIWAFHVHNGQLAYVSVVDGHGVLEKFLQG
jgi:broad specificity phosphatase PhoE